LLIFDENKKIICLSIRHMHLYKSQKNTLNTHLLLSTFRNHYFRRYISMMCLFFLSKTPHITLQILIFRSWEYQEWIFWTFLRLKDKFNPCLNRSCQLRFFIFLKKLGFKKKKTELKKKLIYITLQKTQVW